MKGGPKVDGNNDKTSNNLSPIQEFIAALGNQMRSDAPRCWGYSGTPGPNWLAALFDWWSRTVCNASLKTACAPVINQGFLPGFYSWQGAKQPQSACFLGTYNIQIPPSIISGFISNGGASWNVLFIIGVAGWGHWKSLVVDFGDAAVLVGWLKTKESPTYIFWFLVLFSFIFNVTNCDVQGLVPAELTVCVLLQSCFNVLCFWLFTGYTLDIKQASWRFP